MRNGLYTLVFLIVLTACKHAVPEYNLQKGSRYILIDSTNKTGNLRTYDRGNRVGYYPIYYLGPEQNTYVLGALPIKERTEQRTDTTLKTTRWSDKQMSIFIDTALDIAHKVIYDHYVDSYSENKSEHVIDSIKYFRAYPVFISNIGDSVLYLGNHNYVNFIVREAMNPKGKWITLEAYTRSFECNACRSQFLKPREVMIAKLLRYNGDFKTTCRLRFGNHLATVYSNTFVDYIDKRMLTDSLPSR